MDEQFPYGPFHRKQAAFFNQIMESTGIVGGKAARNIYAGSRPTVKAFVGALPAGATGIEFYTDTPPVPYPRSPPGQAWWPKGEAGVLELEPDPRDHGDRVGVRARITKRVDRRTG